MRYRIEGYSDPTCRFPAFDCEEFHSRRRAYVLCVFVLNESRRLHNELAKISRADEFVDVVIADGGSTDDSVLVDRLRPYNVRTLLVKRGLGKLGAQMRMAFAYALEQGYEGIITVDGNDKDDVMQSLPLFVERLRCGWDHVQGSRYISGGVHRNTPLLRHWGVRVLHAPVISLASGFHYTDTTNGYRAYSKRLLVDPRVAPFRDIFMGYELHYYLAIRAARLGFRVTEIPVTRIYPDHGSVPTKISPFRGNINVLRCLWAACLGHFDPR